MIGPTALRHTSGLGTNWVIDGSGATVDCDAWSNIFNIACWGAGTPVSSLPAGTTVGGTTVGLQTATGPSVTVAPSTNWGSLIFPAAALIALVLLLRR